MKKTLLVLTMFTFILFYLLFMINNFGCQNEKENPIDSKVNTNGDIRNVEQKFVLRMRILQIWEEKPFLIFDDSVTYYSCVTNQTSFSFRTIDYEGSDFYKYCTATWEGAHKDCDGICWQIWNKDNQCLYSYPFRCHNEFCSHFYYCNFWDRLDANTEYTAKLCVFHDCTVDE